ncbi:hypothetical protein D9M71_776750 [compost metagenome]
MQRPGLTQVLHHEQDEGNDEHRIRQLDQAHPLTMQRRPANLCQPAQQCLWKTLLKAQGDAADSQQDGETRDHVLEQVCALLPGAVEGKHQWQQ